MTPELIGIIVATVSLGGLMLTRFAALETRIAAIETRVRQLETELAFLRGLIQGGQRPTRDEAAE